MIPLFKSHYSFGRSILTLENKEANDENSEDSIFPLLKEAGLEELYLIDDHFSGFLEANSVCKKRGIKLNYGLRMTVCHDMGIKNDESLLSNSKVILLANNLGGYYDLIKFYTWANTDGFYYEGRIDWKTLKEYWNDENLTLCIPFYDSYIFNNLLTGKVCYPDLFTEAFYFSEDNDLPFDGIVNNFLAANFENIVPAKSIYYNLRKDFPAYLARRCIDKRSNFDKPNLDHMCSDEFCFESWREKA